MTPIIVDARGLSCPQPLLLAVEAMAAESGTIEVLTDCGASPENVLRAGRSKGWRLVSTSGEDNAVRQVFQKP